MKKYLLTFLSIIVFSSCIGCANGSSIGDDGVGVFITDVIARPNMGQEATLVLQIVNENIDDSDKDKEKKDGDALSDNSYQIGVFANNVLLKNYVINEINNTSLIMIDVNHSNIASMYKDIKNMISQQLLSSYDEFREGFISLSQIITFNIDDFVRKYVTVVIQKSGAWHTENVKKHNKEKVK